MSERINKTWHEQNVMPPKPTMEVRVKWHREHQVHCACRAVPTSVLEAMGEAPSRDRVARKVTPKSAAHKLVARTTAAKKKATVE